MSVIDEMPDEPLAMPGFCPAYHHAIELIGRRWSGVIIRAMIHGATRFSDIHAAIPGISDRLISERLKELEVEGVVVRTVVPSTPVRVDYALTEKGRALGDVVAEVATWAETWCAPSKSDQSEPG